MMNVIFFIDFFADVAWFYPRSQLRGITYPGFVG